MRFRYRGPLPDPLEVLPGFCVLCLCPGEVTAKLGERHGAGAVDLPVPVLLLLHVAADQRVAFDLGPVEAGLLRDLAQLAFLPLAFTADMQPVYYDHSLAPPQELSAAVASLLRKGLITADPLPLLNHSYDEYEDFPHLGSMALTAAGQDAAELLDINGKLC